jgi:HEAT repeat protein
VSIRTCIIALSVTALLCAGPSRAQTFDVDVFNELTGGGTPRQRTPEQLQATYDLAIKTLLIAHDGEHSTTSQEYLMNYEAVYFYASRPDAEPQRLAFCKAAIALLVPATPLDSRVRLIQALERIGRAESAPILKQLLSDSEAEVRESARRALQNNPSAEAAVVLRQALAQATDNLAKVAFVNALGGRNDVESVPAFVSALNASDPGVVSAGATALGNIGNDAAIAALTAALKTPSSPVRHFILDAYFHCAEQLLAQKKNDQAYSMYQALYVPSELLPVRMGAMRGMVLASRAKAMPLLAEALRSGDAQMRAGMAQLLAEDSSPEGIKVALDLLPNAVPDVQALLVGIITGSGSPSARTAILPLASSTDDTVRIAALSALGKFGTAADVPLLARAGSGSPAVVAAARQSLVKMSGNGVIEALSEALRQGNSSTKLLLISVLEARKAAAATPALTGLLNDSDEAVRMAAVDALRTTGDERAIAPLVAMDLKASDEQRRPIELALVIIGMRIPDPEVKSAPVLAALPTATGQAKLGMLRLAGRYGGDKCIAVLHQARSNADAEVRDIAIRALADSPDIKAAPELLDIARTAGNTAGEEAETHKTLALRAYIRLADALAAKSADRISMYKQALTMAGAGEKREVLSGLSKAGSLEAMALAGTLLGDAEVADEAGLAVTIMAEPLAADRANAAAVRTALQKVAGSSASDEVKAEADRVLKAMP